MITIALQSAAPRPYRSSTTSYDWRKRQAPADDVSSPAFGLPMVLVRCTSTPTRANLARASNTEAGWVL
jgi:hypothetical protein